MLVACWLMLVGCLLVLPTGNLRNVSSLHPGEHLCSPCQIKLTQVAVDSELAGLNPSDVFGGDNAGAHANQNGSDPAPGGGDSVPPGSSSSATTGQGGAAAGAGGNSSASAAANSPGGSNTNGTPSPTEDTATKRPATALGFVQDVRDRAKQARVGTAAAVNTVNTVRLNAWAQ